MPPGCLFITVLICMHIDIEGLLKCERLAASVLAKDAGPELSKASEAGKWKKAGAQGMCLASAAGGDGHVKFLTVGFDGG